MEKSGPAFSPVFGLVSVASLEARYLASLVKDSVEEASDLGILCTTVLRLLHMDEDGIDTEFLASVLQDRLGEFNIPAWE